MSKKESTSGRLALALFFYVLFSGILLSLFYQVQHPYLSVSRMLVVNPWEAIVRNFHFWGAQFFFVFSFLHLYNYYRQPFPEKLKSKAVWVFVLGVLFLFMAMLTGFFLKGDADSVRTRQIFGSLIEAIPFAGKYLRLLLMGAKGTSLLIYFHHIITFGVLLLVILVKTNRRIWPKASDFVLLFFSLLFLSMIFSAPLHDGLNPTVKGPWYFVGLQELLHFLRYPAIVLIGLLLFVVLLFYARLGKVKMAFYSKRLLFLFSVIYFLLTLSGLFFKGSDDQWIFPGQKNYRYQVLQHFRTERVNLYMHFPRSRADSAPLIFGRKESCVVCHRQVHGFVASHDPKVIGCYSCHGGNPFATDEKQAHKNMMLIPGNLDRVEQSCGTAACHPQITQRIGTGLMATLNGMINVDRYAFGEQSSPDGLTDVHHLGNSAADEHLRNLCVRCHLGNPKIHPGPVTEQSRGGGCLACHLNYHPQSEKGNHDSIDYSELALQQHPSLDLNISNRHCFGCHSRSGRISTSYEGWHETPLAPAQIPDTGHYRLIDSVRVFRKEPDDVHHRLGLSCIDCHHSYTLMGDGKHYLHEEDQEDVQCEDCHFTDKPLITNAKKMDSESAKVAALRYGKIAGHDYLLTRKHHHVLVNSVVQGDTAWLITKNSGKTYRLQKPAAVCTAPVHADVSCSACHSAWAPSCIGCHNEYDPQERGYNMVLNREKKGSWVEYTGQYLAQLPALGIREKDKKREFVPVIPGMIMTIDRESYTHRRHDSLLFRRLFAPAAPHTTSAKGRSCKTCHNNPVALGFGKGKLTYRIVQHHGIWEFNSTYQDNPHDGLPEDAWTGFLKNRTGMVSTRKNVFPLNVAEQKKMLTVGACLTCHSENSAVMQKSLFDFQSVLQHRSKKCVLPVWK
ncbi:cytochrome b N-terminal domain-containing protein [Candidatus Sulfidibacterium hydrothermale]|uniref:cytochrome b N-terminal domain-containing protein n=1 Tax=Candidatus Sulfidibacterium hydrothermale TaxID=2875962 RepID=UPI001F0B1337|nr:cytochrome b N-terminal domain-containing protein [Candidatus Sulfidibacterium hydrothermale]UBM61873.1 cytochrome b N-terminal domain-containing protein [Candidatus Sulfidibacterium hydrothermale]